MLLVIKVIIDYYKHPKTGNSEIEIATTVFGKQTIRKTNTTLKTDLDHFLDNPTNMEDIDAHIDIYCMKHYNPTKMAIIQPISKLVRNRFIGNNANEPVQQLYFLLLILEYNCKFTSK